MSCFFALMFSIPRLKDPSCFTSPRLPMLMPRLRIRWMFISERVSTSRPLCVWRKRSKGTVTSCHPPFLHIASSTSHLNYEQASSLASTLHLPHAERAAARLAYFLDIVQAVPLDSLSLHAGDIHSLAGTQSTRQWMLYWRLHNELLTEDSCNLRSLRSTAFQLTLSQQSC